MRDAVVSMKIAVMADAHGLTVGMRDVAPFRAAGRDGIRPWGATP